MTTQSHIWIIDDDDSIRWVLQKALEGAGFFVTSFDNANTILEKLKQEEPDAIITDVRMPGIDGLELLSHLSKDYPDLPVIIMTAHTDLDSAVSAYQGGAFEYLPKPFDIDEAVEVTQRACVKKQSNGALLTTDQGGPEIIGAAPAMQEVFRTIGRLSKSVISVLITGESGTGKELVALSLHKHSPRADNAFIALNTAAIPKELLESELFGHERGAFTGAQALRKGRFEQADNGTLFLDEIGDMPAELQTRLLRVLADGVFYRVGGHKSIKTNVRIIAATHRNLEERIKEGEFREDLFYRLNVFPIEMPPLRERSSDIPLLVNELISRFEKDKRGSVRLTPASIISLCQYHWPGNVRELANLIERLVILYPYGVVDLAELPDKFRIQGLNMAEFGDVEELDDDGIEDNYRNGEAVTRLPDDNFDLKEHLSNMEYTFIKQALDEANGVVAHAAKRLNMRRTTLVEKLRKYDLQRSEEATNF